MTPWLLMIVYAVPWQLVALFIAALLSRALRTTFAQGSISNDSVRTCVTFLRLRYALASGVDSDNPEGWVFGRWFAAYVTRDNRGNKTIWLVMPKWCELTTVEESAPQPRGHAVILWGRSGGAKYGMYYTKTRSVFSGEPTPEQADAVDRILGLAETSEQNGFSFNLVALLHGPPLSGKSRVAFFLARRTGGVVCAEHNPLDAGDDLQNLVQRANPTRDRPLIVVLNEWDVRCRSVFESPGKFRTADVIPRVWDKGSLNDYMDSLSNYNNVIFILTSNVSPEAFAEIDPSVVREGRVDATISMCAVDATRKRAALRFAPAAATATAK